MVIDDQKKKSVNHTAKQIVPFRAKNYQPLPTIAMIMGGQQLPTIRTTASHAGRIKTDAGEQVDAGEQADAERQAKKRLGVGSAEHRTLARSADRRY